MCDVRAQMLHKSLTRKAIPDAIGKKGIEGMWLGRIGHGGSIGRSLGNSHIETEGCKIFTFRVNYLLDYSHWGSYGRGRPLSGKLIYCRCIVRPRKTQWPITRTASPLCYGFRNRQI